MNKIIFLDYRYKNMISVRIRTALTRSYKPFDICRIFQEAKNMPGKNLTDDDKREIFQDCLPDFKSAFSEGIVKRLAAKDISLDDVLLCIRSAECLKDNGGQELFEDTEAKWIRPIIFSLADTAPDASSTMLFRDDWASLTMRFFLSIIDHPKLAEVFIHFYNLTGTRSEEHTS
ncbi:MAG: hypothetical protein PHY92_05725, partial [Alphaproteobacteria bacterium]|nr:hypothetical protein [Alphaproteobacteria bacterium]